MKKITGVLTRSITNTSLVIFIFLGTTVLTSFLIVSSLYSIFLFRQSRISTDFLNSPLISFSLNEGAGTTVLSTGSIKNLSATMDGNKVFWESINQTANDYPATLTGLIGYWKLNNNLNDDSGNNFSAVAQGGINCLDNPGFIGQGCSFGSFGQYLDISKVDTKINPKSGTISAWAYPTANNNAGYIIQGVGSGSDRYYIQWLTSGRFRVVKGDDTLKQYGTTITLKQGAELNQWYHLVMSWEEKDGKKIVYGYLNGQLIGLGEYSSPGGLTPRFRIGNQANPTENRSFEGQIDEVAFFDRKLSDEEIKNIYENGQKNAHPTTSTEKFLYFDNKSTGEYGRLRINNHTELQKLNLTDAFTIEAEVYLTSYPIDVNSPYTIYTDYVTLSSANALAIMPNGKVRVYANTGNTRFIFTADQSQVPLNQWVKISGSFNKNTQEMSILIDNNEYSTNTPEKKDGIAKNFGRPIIGMSGVWQQGLKGGFIKNLKLWNNSFLIGQYLSNCNPLPAKNSQGLIAAFNFNNSILDTSGNNIKTYFFGLDGASNPIQAMTNPVFTNGLGDKAIVFDGNNDYLALNMQYCGSISSINELTVCARFKTNENTGGDFDNWALIDFDRSEYYNLFVTPSGKLGFSTHSAQDNSVNDLYSKTNNLNDNQWHFVCGVYNYALGQKSLYIDGKEDTTIANVHHNKPLGSSLTRFGFIGDGSEAASLAGLQEFSKGDAGRNQVYFKGAIDEVLIYNKSLSLIDLMEIQRRSDRAFSNSNSLKYCSELLSEKGIAKCFNYIALSIPKDAINYDTLYDQRVDEVCGLVPNCFANESLIQSDFKIAAGGGAGDRPIDRLKKNKLLSGKKVQTIPFWGTLTCNAKKDKYGTTKPGELKGEDLVICGENPDNCAERIYGPADDNPYIGTNVRVLVAKEGSCPDLGQDQACRANDKCLCEVVGAAGGPNNIEACKKCFNPDITLKDDGSEMYTMGVNGLPTYPNVSSITGTKEFLENVREIFDCIDGDNSNGCDILPPGCTIGTSYRANDGPNHGPGIALDMKCCSTGSDNSTTCNVPAVETLINRIESCRTGTKMNIIRECTDSEQEVAEDVEEGCGLVHVDTRDRDNADEPCTYRNNDWNACNPNTNPPTPPPPPDPQM